MRVISNDNHLPQNHHKKGVTFNAMEMLERNSNSIDKLASLVSDMKMTMNRKQSPYKPKIYQGGSQNQNAGRQNFTPRNRSFSRGRNQSGNRGNYNYRNNYRPNYRNRSRGRWNRHRSGDRSSNYQNNNIQGNMRLNYRKMPNGLLETEVKVEIEMEITTMTIREVEAEIDMITGLFSQEEKNLGPDPILE